MGSILSSLASVRKKFSDTFNRADQTGIGTASDGSTWQTLNGGFNIEGSKAKGVSSSYPIAAITFPQKNVSIDLAGISQGASAALWVTDSGNWWAVGIDQAPVDCNCQTCSDIIGYNASNCTSYNAAYNFCTGSYNADYYFCPVYTTSGGNCNAYTNAGGSCKTYSNAGGNCKTFNTVNSFCSYQYFTINNCNFYNAYNSRNKTGGNCGSWNKSNAVCGVYGNSGGNCAGTYNTVNSTCNATNAVNSTCNGNINAYVTNCVPGTSTFTPGNCINQYVGPQCATANQSNAIYGPSYSCNCQTCYPQYIRIMQSVGSTVSQITSWVISGVAQSLRIRTSGDQITVKAYSDPSLVSQIDSDLIYTPTGAAVNSKFGIAIKPSTYNQGYTIDQVVIDKN
jgi:hypothetical protein